MAKAIHQFRFYKNQSNEMKNYPAGETMGSFIDGSVFDGFYPICQLGIQTIPGTYFFLNEGNDPIIIGSTGIYELDLTGETEITKMTFEQKSMENINNMANGYLIVDIIYDKELGGSE